MRILKLFFVAFAAGIASSLHAETGTEIARCVSAPPVLVDRAARRGEDAASFYIGKQLLREGCTNDIRRDGLAILEELASRDHAPTLLFLGRLVLASGSTVAVEAEAIAMIRQSARLGEPEAQALYGLLLVSDAQDAQQRDEGFYWLGSAANNGIVQAALTVSVIYAEGMHGVAKDQCIAKIWRDAAHLLVYPGAKARPSPAICE